VEIRTVITRLSVVAVGCALSVSVAAQQSAPAAPAGSIAQASAQASDEQLERTRTEVRTFEIVLFQAIEAAGQKLASWAAPMAPTVMLTPAAAPIITGLLLPDYQRLPKPQVRQGLPGQGPGQAVSSDRVTTTTVVADDPMKGAAVSPDKMYSDFVRLGLMDAILDSSSVLTLRENQWLSVAAVPVDVAVTNPLYRNTSRKLILSIKAEDLAAFRAGKITRDEAKLKIVDTRF
jgi:hypothetical protein